MTTRLNLSVADDIPEKLAALAGGERKRGQFLTNLIRSLYDAQATTQEGMDIEALRLQVLGLAGQVKALEARLAQVEKTLAVLIADNAERET